MLARQTRTYLALKYGVCPQTITKLLAQRCNITHGGMLTPMDVALFVQKVGTPEQLKKALDLIKS